MARSVTTEYADSDLHGTTARHEGRFRRCWSGLDRTERPTRERRRAVPTAPPAPPPPRAKPVIEPPAQARKRTAAPSAAFIGFSVLVGAGYGLLERGLGGDWPEAGVVAGVACVVSLLTLHVLHLMTRIAMQATKIVVPAALLLAVGHILEWHWAVEVTDVLQHLWLASVEQVQAFWARSV